ncbi:MAG: hypothetical protein GY828_08200 [Candidatus Gracilibacteria bacterium]|nr:hypothetical protein [Candidatus Gracilibacteria bacterium]
MSLKERNTIIGDSDEFSIERIRYYTLLQSNITDLQVKEALQVMIDFLDILKYISNDERNQAILFLENKGIKVHLTGNEIRMKIAAIEEALELGKGKVEDIIMRGELK